MTQPSTSGAWACCATRCGAPCALLCPSLQSVARPSRRHAGLRNPPEADAHLCVNEGMVDA